jgi:hypothetical protein
MTPDDRDRAAREIEELRQLFSANGRPVGRRFDAVARTGRVKDAEAAEADEQARGAEAEAGQKVIKPPARTRRDEQRAPVWQPAPRNGTSRRSQPPPTPPRAKDPPVKVFDRAEAVESAPPEPEAPAELPGTTPAVAREPARRPVDDPDRDRQGPENRGREQGGPQVTLRVSLRRVAVLLLPVLLAVTFAVGLGLGRKLDSSQAPAATPAPVNASTVTSTPAPPPPAPAPSACLDTARYGDQVIAMLTANIRDQRINDPMRNYAKASQACRAAVSAP